MSALPNAVRMVGEGLLVAAGPSGREVERQAGAVADGCSDEGFAEAVARSILGATPATIGQA